MDNIWMQLFFIVWGISELVLLIFRRRNKTQSVQDKNSILQIIVLIVSLTIGITYGLNLRYFNFLVFSGNPFIWQVVAIIPLVAGIVIRWAAILTLRKYFTTNLTIQEDHKVIQHGLYRWIRHPSYTGSIISFIGFSLFFCNWVSLFSILIPNLFLFILRIRFEENMLIKHFGDDYKQYQKKTRKLIPFIY